MYPPWQKIIRKQLKSIISLILFFNLSQISVAIAQYPESDFELYTSRHGLPDNNVMSVAKDTKGFMWFGTESGLSRFDGAEFIDFSHGDNPITLSVSNIHKIVVFSKNRLGIVTSTGFVMLDTDKYSLRQYAIPDSTIFTFYLNNIKDAIEMNSGNILLLTHTGLYELQPDGKIRFRYDAYKPEDIKKTSPLFGRSLISLKANEYIVVNEKNWVGIYKADEKKFLPVSREMEKYKHFFPMQKWNFGRVLKMANQEFVIADIRSDTIKYYDIETGRIVYSTLPFDKIKELDWTSEFFKLSDTSFAITCRENGYYIFNINKNTGKIYSNKQKYLSRYKCNALFLDEEKRLWVATRTGLLKQKLAPSFISTNEISSPLFSRDKLPSFNCVFRQKNKFYFGAHYDSSSLVIVDTATMQVTGTKMYKTYDNNFSAIYSIQQYYPDTLWLGTSNGIWWYDVISGNTGPIRNADGSIFLHHYPIKLYPPDKYGYVWVCSILWGAVARYHPLTREFQVFDSKSSPAIPFKSVKSIVYDAYGDVWLGGHGLARWNNKLQAFDTLITTYAGPLKLKDDIVAITADKKGSLWLHNAGNGLLEYNIRERRFYHYDGIQYGLGSFAIQAMANEVVEDKLWYTTGTRLGCFDINTKTAITFDQRDGIPEKRSSARTLFYDAGVNKYYSLHDNNFISFNAAIPVSGIFDNILRFTSLHTGSKAFYYPGNNIQLPSDNRYFQLRYAVLDYENANGCNFFYKVNGGEWINNHTNKSITLSGIGAGKYQITLRAIGKFGQETSTEILVYIAYPFWQRWWFIALVVFAVGSLVYWVYRFRVNQIKELSMMRSGISRDLHDEIGSTLSGISLYSHLTELQLREADIAGAGSSLVAIQQNAGEVVNKLSDIVWLTNPEQDSLKKLTERLETYATEMALPKNINVEINISGKIHHIELPIEVKKNIFLICKEAVHNAIMYSNATKIKLEVKDGHGQAVFLVADNGKGFDTDNGKKGNGIGNMKKRADEIGAAFTISSGPNHGTRVELIYKIPQRGIG